MKTIVAGLLTFLVVDVGAILARAGAADDVRLAQQWSDMSKQRPTPAPRQTPAGDRGERREESRRPGVTFGGMQK